MRKIAYTSDSFIFFWITIKYLYLYSAQAYPTSEALRFIFVILSWSVVMAALETIRII